MGRCHSRLASSVTPRLRASDEANGDDEEEEDKGDDRSRVFKNYIMGASYIVGCQCFLDSSEFGSHPPAPRIPFLFNRAPLFFDLVALITVLAAIVFACNATMANPYSN